MIFMTRMIEFRDTGRTEKHVTVRKESGCLALGMAVGSARRSEALKKESRPTSDLGRLFID